MTYWYVATPFTKYPHGHEAAYRLACVETARLLRAGIPCLSPIAHGFGLHAHGGLPVVDAVLWHRVNLPLMMGAAGCIVIMAPRREHSRKPDEVYGRIEQLVAGPYVELFARQRWPGWHAWGNEIDKFGGEK